MEQNYYSVKVTISPLEKEGRYRSRIVSREGASFGIGNDFDLSDKVIKEFSDALSQGAVSSEDTEAFGKRLFALTFDGDVREKYGEVKGIALARKLKLRICLALHSPELINIPWEFLHDGNNFLIQHGWPMVRVLDELAGAKSSFAPIQKVLVAAANPKSPDYDPFDANKHIQDLCELLGNSQIVPEVLAPASRETLLAKVRLEGFDALYFVGHGEALSSGGRLICEGTNGSPEPLTATDLASNLRQAPSLRFVYLNSCSTGRTGVDNPFRGVAQRLMLDGDVAAVAAMQVDVRQAAALDMARSFFANLVHQSPEEAMHAARTAAKDVYSFGVPVLYSYLDAPDQYDKNRLQSFLCAHEQSKYALVLPSFVLGQPAEEGHVEPPQDDKYRYLGETFAKEDAKAAVNVIDLLAQVTAPENVLICVLGETLPNDRTHYFLFGSRSNKYVPAVQREFQDQFEFGFLPAEWFIHDKKYQQEYRVPAPDKPSTLPYQQRADYGVIQKIQADDRVYFVLAGLGSRATQGCGWYFYRKWREHLTDKEFAIILRFPGGLDFGQARLIDRTTGKPKSGA